MTVYFFFVLQAYVGIILYLSLYGDKVSVRDVFIGSVVGVLSGFAVFQMANAGLATDGLKIFNYSFAQLLLMLGFIPLIFRFKFSKIVFLSSIIFCFSVYYRIISYDFPLFSGELLDSVSIISFGFTLFGFLSIAVLYLLLRYVVLSLSKKIRLIFILIAAALLIIRFFADNTLEMMRFGLINTYSTLLSVVAKIIHYNSFSLYAYLCLILCLVVFYISKLPKTPIKKGNSSAIYRKIKAKRMTMLNAAKALALTLIASYAIVGYYDFYASKPPKLSQAKILEPVEGEFKIRADILNDNDLHRFAYVTDAGNKIRFFALNRFADKMSPVVVFDACLICGDMGYIKSGGELICISCNVRIFLPSVGKEGGCNPIPLKYEFDGEWISVKLEDLEKGVNYFSEIVEKEVADPISGEKMINLKAPYNYFYGGKTYFFKTKENYIKFMEKPDNYASHFKDTHWRTQGFVTLRDDI